MEPPPFSLGNVILKTADSPVHAPDTFRDDLLHKYLDAASRAAVAQTCKAGRAWLLEEWAETATLSVQVRAGSAERAPEVLRHLQRARQQLDQRQSSMPGRSTGIMLQQHSWIGKEDTTWWHVPLSVLAASAPPSTLTLRLQRIPAGLLQCSGAAWPALTSLSLEQLRGAEGAVKLPPISALPALRRLIVGWVSRRAQAQLWASVGPYLPQLQSLTIEKQPAPASLAERPAWASVFSAGTKSHTLHSVSVPADLTLWLSQSLLQYAPALQTHTVTSVSRYFGEPLANPVCSWRTVRCTDGSRVPHQTLSWLPLPASGKLVIELQGPGGLEVCLPVCDAIAQKFTRIQLQGAQCINVILAGMRADSQPEALRAALPHLEHFRNSEHELSLYGCIMTPALAAALHDAAAGWAHLSMHELRWPAATGAIGALPACDSIQLSEQLNDRLLGDLLTSVTQLDTLHVAGLQLSRAVAAGTRIPWRRVALRGDMQLCEWLRQVEFMGGDVEWCVDTTLTLRAEQVASEEAGRIAEQFRALRLARLDALCVCVSPSKTSLEQQPGMLRAALSLMSALPCKPKKLWFRGWSATSDVIREVKALSDMPWLEHSEPEEIKLTLGLRSCGRVPSEGEEWPLAQLPKYIPRSYSTWSVEAGDMYSKELTAFIDNIPTDRTVTTPLKIKVIGKGEEWANTTNTHLLKTGTCPFVHFEAI